MEITEKTSVEELLSIYPQLTNVFIKLGLSCYVCGEAFWGTIGELAQKYNVNVNKIIRILNEEKSKLNQREV
ncbi:MAG: DUF1858 domain-containing protein [candidate division WOR-3 bacterium]